MFKILTFIAALSFIMSPFALIGLLSWLKGWNDMQQMGAMMMACIFSPLLMGVLMAMFPNGFGER